MLVLEIQKTQVQYESEQDAYSRNKMLKWECNKFISRGSHQGIQDSEEDWIVKNLILRKRMAHAEHALRTNTTSNYMLQKSQDERQER